MNDEEVKISRTLEQVCEESKGGFHEELLGNHYCMLAPTQDRVECFYRGEKPDENGIYNCNNPKYNIENNIYQIFDGVGHC